MSPTDDYEAPNLHGLKLHLVQCAVWEGHAKWYNIGLQLGIDAGELDSIRESEHYDPDRCLTSTLKKWLRSGFQPSWSSLASALRAPTVGLGHLADQIDAYWQYNI